MTFQAIVGCNAGRGERPRESINEDQLKADIRSVSWAGNVQVEVATTERPMPGPRLLYTGRLFVSYPCH